MSLALAMRRRAMGKAAAPFSPADISGLLLWLKADAITGLGNDAPVATWPDSSGFGRDATQAAAGPQPLYKASSMNGKPALAFDGNDWLESVQNCNTKPTTVISVVGVTNFTTPRTVIGASTNALQHRIDATSGKQTVFKQGEIGVGSSTSAIDTLIPTIVTFTYGTTGAWAFYKNGVADGQGTNDQVFGSGTTTIGSFSRGGGEFLLGRCAEILKYDRVLTAAELTDVHNHLKAKYRIGEVLASDTWTGANGAAWDMSKWTEAVANATGSVTIQANAGQMVASGAAYAYCRALATLASTADLDVLVSLVLDSVADESYPHVALRGDGTWDADSPSVQNNSYRFQLNTAGTQTLFLYKNVAGADTSLGSVAVTASTAKRWLRCQAIGSTLRARTWFATDAEPTTWNLSVTDTAHTTGKVNLTHVAGAGGAVRTATWDDMTVTAL